MPAYIRGSTHSMSLGMRTAPNVLLHLFFAIVSGSEVPLMHNFPKPNWFPFQYVDVPDSLEVLNVLCLKTVRVEFISIVKFTACNPLTTLSFMRIFCSLYSPHIIPLFTMRLLFCRVTTSLLSWIWGNFISVKSSLDSSLDDVVTSC